MGRTVTAEFDAEHLTLRLLEPVDGLSDHERVQVTISRGVDSERPWMALSNTLSGEDGEAFTRAIDEMFPIER